MPPLATSEDSQLVASLTRLSSKNSKLVKSSTYPAPADPSITVRSWKMNEYMYYEVPSPFPTLARGLFTTESEEGQYRIVARGYDKFFNIGEVPWTTWAALEVYTKPPYTLSLKANGCIIFISALTPSKLLITSKHSLGPIKGVAESHAQAGQRWLQIHLENVGKTEEQLAATLWENNWTAIAELCDDSFEEHVLAYPPERSGLHLHGLNRSVKAFNTLPAEQVDAFAAEWGFIKTLTTTISSLQEVKSFTDEVAKTGEWNGEALEGFVVRTHIVDEWPKEAPTPSKKSQTPPYPPGSTFFFKIKFDEPYMMYRDWRELTRTLLSANAKGKMGVTTLSKAKMQRPETKKYVAWVIREIEKSPSLFEGYAHGKGIISTRERFLKSLEAEDQKEAEAPKPEEPVKEQQKFGKTIIVPVAIPGCGKTMVSVALSHLFGCGHIQSDDIKAKKPAPIFIGKVVELLDKCDVVIADKNNHLRVHRDALRLARQPFKTPVRLLGLDWSRSIVSLPFSTAHSICTDRVQLRGDKHQTLRPDTSEARHEVILRRFRNELEELSDVEVDACVEMEMEDTAEEAVRRAVEGVCKELGLEKPSEERIQAALEAAKSYVPEVKPAERRKAPKLPRYFGLLPELDLQQTVEAAMMQAPADGQLLWANLKKGDRVTKRPHVTIVHVKTLPKDTDLWEGCLALQQLPVSPLYTFKLGSVVWNERIMAVTIDDLQVDTEKEGNQVLDLLETDLRRRLHITVGTRDGKVAPVEAGDLVTNWRAKGDGEGIASVSLGGMVAKGRIKGLFQ